MKNTIALHLIAFEVGIIALKKAGVIPPVRAAVSRLDSTVPITTRIDGTMPITGSANVANTVSVHGSVEVDKPVSLLASVDVNLSAIFGRPLVESQTGMHIGVKSISNTVIPIHWGEITVDGLVDVVANKREQIERTGMTIEHLHKCRAVYFATVPVHEVFKGQTVSHGNDEAFTRSGHPKAQKAYGWAEDQGGKERFFAILEIPLVSSALDAVRASIVADAKRANAKGYE